MGGRKLLANSAPCARGALANASGATSSQRKTPHSSSSHAKTTHWSELGSSHVLRPSCADSSQMRTAGEAVLHSRSGKVPKNSKSKDGRRRGFVMMIVMTCPMAHKRTASSSLPASLRQSVRCAGVHARATRLATLVGRARQGLRRSGLRRWGAGERRRASRSLRRSRRPRASRWCCRTRADLPCRPRRARGAG
jgi:hypothetical protein